MTPSQVQAATRTWDEFSPPSGTCAPTGLETIRTDKADYLPEETVHTTGTGYTPSCDVVVRVTRPDGSVVKGNGTFEPGSDIVTTDADGNLAYDYILDGIDGEYTIEVLGAGGALLAFTIFTDSIASDCFRTVASGNWNATSTWESATTASACTTWASATLTPTSTANTITIRSGHNVTVTAAVTADQVTVDSGGTLTVNGSVTLSLADGTGTDLTVNGTLSVSGSVAMGSSVSTTISSTGTTTVNSGGAITGAGGGNSTKSVLTIASTATSTIAGGITGSLYQVDLNGLVSLTGNISVNSNSAITVTGSVSVASTGSINLGGGTPSSAYNINSGGVVDYASGSTNTHTGDNPGANPTTVFSGGTLRLRGSALITSTTGGPVTINSGANLEIGSAAGISSLGATGNIQVAGTRTFNIGANYSYIGVAAQITGTGLPATVNTLTVANSGGNVTLTNASTTVSSALTLTSGDLSTGAGANVVVLAAAATCNGTTDVISGAAATGGVSRTTIGTGTTRCFGNPNNQITINSGTAPTAITVKLVKAAPAGKPGAVTRTYSITPTGGSGISATVRLHYLDVELNFNTESWLHLWKLSGSWSDQDPTGASTTRDMTANWVQQTGISSFGDWTLADDITAPVAPTITSSSPSSPANENNPEISGTAEAGSTVRIYTSSTCTTGLAATGSAATFTTTGLTVTVLDNTTTSFYATATDAANNVSLCSTAFVTYVEDSTAPQTTINTTPSNPTNDTTPTFTFSADEPATFQCRIDGGAYAACSSPASFGPLADGSHTFDVFATDTAGNPDPTPASYTWTIDTAAPNAPVPTTTSPSLPANDNFPEISGTAALDVVSVELFSDSTCATFLAAGSRATFVGGGITITVGNNTTTDIYATGTDAAANTSACSVGFVTYVEDSAAPAAPTPTTTSPSSPANDNTPEVSGTAEAGSTVRIYTNATCTTLATSGTAAAFAAPGLTVSVGDNATTNFYATATDAANNVSSCSSPAFTYVEDSAAPVITLVNPATGSSTTDTTPTFSGTAGAQSGDSPTVTVRIYAGTNTSGALVQTLTTTRVGTTYSVDSAALAPGTYTAQASQSDSAGNTGLSSANTFTVTPDEPLSDTAGPLRGADPLLPALLVLGAAAVSVVRQALSSEGCVAVSAGPKVGRLAVQRLGSPPPPPRRP